MRGVLMLTDKDGHKIARMITLDREITKLTEERRKLNNSLLQTYTDEEVENYYEIASHCLATIKTDSETF